MKNTEDELYKWYKAMNDGVDGVRNNMQNNMGSRNLLTFMVALFTLSSAQNAEKIVDFIGKSIQKEVSAVKHPIEEGLVLVGSSQCSHVKRLVGVAYEQVEGENEPDLNQLTLVYKDRTKNVTLSIIAAATWLAQTRRPVKDQRLVIFIHGFTDNPQKDNFLNISMSFLQTDDIGVLALDGSSLIRWLYLRSSTYVRFMGQKLAEVLAALVQHGQDPSHIHLIGHSLGAHISGFAGKTFKELTGMRIGRISGLDPAGPCFSHVDPELRLKETDAFFVDAMHTDSGVFGLKDRVGHMDFYPNNGAQQPNCLLQSCSHSRAVVLYAESVLNPKAFPAVRCRDWDEFKRGECVDHGTYMGYPAKLHIKGSYFLRTKGEFPFGLGQEGTKYVNDEGIIRNIGNLFG